MPRPALTEDDVRQRVADYCSRYGVATLSPAGMPPFPTGKRETRQHREWVVLYKAVQRVRKRDAAGDLARRAAALEAQKGSCPICLEPADAAAAVMLVRADGNALA